MAKVVEFNKVRKGKAKNSESVGTFTDVLNKDIDNLCTATGLDNEGAIKMAEDFYRKYPALIEHVRDANNLLRRK